jgi:hypothetical protein
MKRLDTSVLLVVALCVSACSSDSSTSAASPTTTSPSALSAADYISGVCTALAGYQDSLSQAQQGFTPQTSDLAALKQSWLDLLDKMLASTQTLVSDMQALGVPDTSEGQQAAAALKSDFEKLQQDLQQLRDESESLSPSDPTSFISAFEPMVQQFQTDMSSFGQDLDRFNGGELDQAFSDAPECAQFASGSPSASASST